MAILTEVQVTEIRRLCAGGMPRKAVASQFDISVRTVCGIVRRESWK
ncbi:helix-turn-helix domain-containing protein [Frankia sp. Cj3]